MPKNRWGSGRRCLVAGAGDSLAVVSAALASAGFTSTHARCKRIDVPGST